MWLLIAPGRFIILDPPLPPPPLWATSGISLLLPYFQMKLLLFQTYKLTPATLKPYLIAAITNYQQFSGLKPHKLILFEFQR